MILIVCALPQELRYLDEREGVELFACGVGPVEAGVRTAAKLASARYDALVNAGIGGAFRGRAALGDAVLVARDTFADFGLEGGGELALPPGTLVDEALADPDLLRRVAGTELRRVDAVTVSAVTATEATGLRLAARYGAAVESMEGFAIFRAATLAGVPALQCRGISNYVGDRSRSEWNFEAGARAAASALERVLDAFGTHPARGGHEVDGGRMGSTEEST